jgi:HD-GYP domain-containing protein (c-di-GMP phosphodiesterase class II)
VITPTAEAARPAVATGQLRLRLTGVPESARQRLVAIGAEIVADGAIHAEVLSTRLAPEELAEVSGRLADTPHPVVVLAHTGAERLAAELVGAGAVGLVGEGNEEALLGLVEDERAPGALLASFERRFGDGGSPDGRGRDPQTGLLDRRGFERRIGTLGDAGDVPRIVFLRVVSERWTAPVPDPVVTLQRRRLASALSHVTSVLGTELYATAAGEFGLVLVGTELSSDMVEHLADRLVQVAKTFRDRSLPLRLVVGHAGPESSADTDELIDLARRALDVASVDNARHVLGAEQLALGVSVTTELEASLKIVAAVEGLMPEGKGHGERVGRIAAELARSLAWSPAAVARVQLAGHLHDVGRAALPREAVAGPDGLSDDLLESWRSFPARGADALKLTAGPVVAAAVRSQCERWDGEGFPEGRRGVEIPEAARVLSVAHAIEELTLANRSAPSAAIAERLRGRAGTELERELVEVAVSAMTSLLQAAGRVTT